MILLSWVEAMFMIERRAQPSVVGTLAYFGVPCQASLVTLSMCDAARLSWS